MDITKQFEDRDSFLKWFLIASLAGVNVKGAVTEVPRIVTMQLNGVELNPEAAIKRLDEQFDRLVAEKAQELFEEMKRDILEPFEDKVKEMTDAVSALVEDGATAKPTMEEFEKELTHLINRCSIENVADMPDFLLAEMICRMIEAMGPSIKKTLDWHGCDSVCHPSPNGR